MIRGIGIDIIEVRRIRQTLARHGERFLERVMTPAEIALAPGGLDRAPFFAGRWAVKEAISKMLGTGIGPGCSWTEICVLNHPSGQPYVTLAGSAAATATALGIVAVHVSISHLKTLACACAVGESA